MAKRKTEMKKPNLSGGAASLTDGDLDALSRITDADILEADEVWQAYSSRHYKELLRAEDGEEPIADDA